MECVLCDEPITNPLCPECLEVAVRQWLALAAPEKMDELRSVTDAINATVHTTGVQCIRCHTDFSICTYCYTKEIFNWLKKGALQVRFGTMFPFIT